MMHDNRTENVGLCTNNTNTLLTEHEILGTCRQLCGIYDLVHFAHSAILFFLLMKIIWPEQHQAGCFSAHVGRPESTKNLILPIV